MTDPRVPTGDPSAIAPAPPHAERVSLGMWPSRSPPPLPPVPEEVPSRDGVVPEVLQCCDVVSVSLCVCSCGQSRRRCFTVPGLVPHIVHASVASSPILCLYAGTARWCPHLSIVRWTRSALGKSRSSGFTSGGLRFRRVLFPREFTPSRVKCVWTRRRNDSPSWAEAKESVRLR